jgi:two-component system, cell cycle response regulator
MSRSGAWRGWRRLCRRQRMCRQAVRGASSRAAARKKRGLLIAGFHDGRPFDLYFNSENGGLFRCFRTCVNRSDRSPMAVFCIRDTFEKPMSIAEENPTGLETCADVFQLAQLRALNQQGQEPKTWLVQIYPAERIGRLVNLTNGSITLGRDDHSGVMFDDVAVSRQHAKIERLGDDFVVTDLGSRNGTYVNDEAVPSHRLHNGDRIRVGHQILKFVAADQFEEQYYELVYKMMTTDGLTEAYNKRYLLDVLDRDLARARRTGQLVSVLMIDLDGFKNVNDTHGHPIGDDVLHQLCDRIRGVLRCDEVLARYGGEEFTVLLAHSCADEAQVVAERVRKIVAEKPYSVGVVELVLTVSIGVATTRGEETTAQLMAEADRNLYLAKQRGRNCVVA